MVVANETEPSSVVVTVGFAGAIIKTVSRAPRSLQNVKVTHSVTEPNSVVVTVGFAGATIKIESVSPG